MVTETKHANRQPTREPQLSPAHGASSSQSPTSWLLSSSCQTDSLWECPSRSPSTRPSFHQLPPWWQSTSFASHCLQKFVLFFGFGWKKWRPSKLGNTSACLGKQKFFFFRMPAFWQIKSTSTGQVLFFQLRTSWMIANPFFQKKTHFMSRSNQSERFERSNVLESLTISSQLLGSIFSGRAWGFAFAALLAAALFGAGAGVVSP